MEHKSNDRMDKKKRDKFVRYSEGTEMYHMSQSKFMQLAKDAKICYKVGQMVSVKLEIVDGYLESFRIVDNIGKETFVTVKKNPIDYVTREELSRLEEEIIREAVIAAKDEMLRMSLGAKEDKVSKAYVPKPTQEVSRLDEEIISNLAMSYL